MLLGEALQILKQPAGQREMRLHLLCGFTPLHLQTFTQAYLRLRFPDVKTHLGVGLFGDLEGNLQRACEVPASGALVVIEWSDLDSRLSFRASAGWRVDILEDVAAQIDEKCSRLVPIFAALGAAMPVAVAAPSLPMPPLGHLPPARSSALEIRLQATVARFLEHLAGQKGVNPISRAALDAKSPAPGRYDPKVDLRTGFPYTLTHADAVAALGVACLFPQEPKKGLITDLDNTLWKGILGDDGIDGVSWNLENDSQQHALYQQLLASLADTGIMIGVASKNDLELVRSAFARPDALLSSEQVFPFEVNWGAKSESVGRILRAWNVAADSVVFVDDSPLELAEVAEAYPAMECLRFTNDDPAGVVSLLVKLRERFGKSELRDEDRLRLGTLRSAVLYSEDRTRQAPEEFQRRLQAKIQFDVSSHPSDSRAFELVNKTNQFNLNGVRFTEAEWSAYFDGPEAFLLTVSYEDRFGPLGRIAVVAGRIHGNACRIDTWVMSCRAFSRNIEFQVLRWLYQFSGAVSLTLAFTPTGRNTPLQEFLRAFFPDELKQDGLNLTAHIFEKACPPLFHQTMEIDHRLPMAEKPQHNRL